MTAKYVDTLRTTWVTSLGTAVGNAGKLLLCSGTKPATKGTGTPTTLRAFTCGAPFFASVTNGVGTATAIAAVSAGGGGAAPGTNATWARLTTSADVFVADLDVTATGGGGDLTLDAIAIVTGASIAITSLTITAPGA